MGNDSVNGQEPKNGRLMLSRRRGERLVLRMNGRVIGMIGIDKVRENKVKLEVQMIDEVLVLRQEIDGENVDPRKPKPPVETKVPEGTAGPTVVAA